MKCPEEIPWKIHTGGLEEVVDGVDFLRVIVDGADLLRVVLDGVDRPRVILDGVDRPWEVLIGPCDSSRRGLEVVLMRPRGHLGGGPGRL